MRILYMLFFLFLTLSVTKAQDKVSRFGKISIEDMKMTVYDKDSSARAVILSDKGFSELVYDLRSGFHLVHTRHKRVKILTKDAYNMADVRIRLYHSAGNTETISAFKAATYNLEGGKVVSSKLDKKAVFTEEIDDNWTSTNFTFPNVKEGSIIEYSYKLRSDFIFNLQDWQFQTYVPTRWSEYRVEIPEYFKYESFAQGSVGLAIDVVETKTDKLKYSYETEQIGGKRTEQSGEVEYIKKIHHWAARDVPGFKQEAYMPNSKNFISSINFELAQTNLPGASARVYMGSWYDVNASFLRNQYFGQMVTGSGFLQEEVDKVTSRLSDDQSKIAAIFNYVRSKVSWDGNYARYASESQREILKDGKGNVADVNLLLTNLLRKAGLNADPVLISTRAHGFVRKQFPLSSQFNYVVAVVDLGGGPLLLDATSGWLPINLLPERCLNGNGWRVSEDNAGWLKITSGGVAGVLLTGELNPGENGVVSGDLSIAYSDYRASYMRSSYRSDEDLEEYLSSANGWEVSNLKSEGINSAGADLKISCMAEVSQGTEVLGDLIYLNPFVAERIQENPFKADSRDFPVDFTSSIRTNYMVTINVPKGYVVDFLPVNLTMSLPANAGKFTYYLQQMDGKIAFRSAVQINKSLFPNTEYPFLKEFFRRIVEKQAEMIVFKKAT